MPGSAPASVANSLSFNSPADLRLHTGAATLTLMIGLSAKPHAVALKYLSDKPTSSQLEEAKTPQNDWEKLILNQTRLISARML